MAKHKRLAKKLKALGVEVCSVITFCAKTGFGQLRRRNGQRIMLHRMAVNLPAGKALSAGQKVHAVINERRCGMFMADSVMPI